MNVVCLYYYISYIPRFYCMGIVFDTYGYLIFSLPLPSLLCWVSFSIPMLACNAPLWSGCPSLLPGIVFDTHQPVLVSSPPSHRYRFQYPRLCRIIHIADSLYYWVSFSIPMRRWITIGVFRRVLCRVSV